MPVKIESIEKRIRRWQEQPADDNQELIQLAVMFRNKILNKYPVNKKINVRKLAEDIFGDTFEDCQARGGMQKYELVAYYSDAPAAAGAHYTMAMYASGSDEDEEDEGNSEDMTEPATGKGMFAQGMRHLENRHQSFDKREKALNESMHREIDRLTTNNIDQLEIIRQQNEQIHKLRDNDFEKQIRFRKVLFHERIREEAARYVLPYLPMVIGALAQKTGMFGKVGPAAPSAPAGPPMPPAPAQGALKAPFIPPSANVSTAPPGTSANAPEKTIEQRFRLLYGSLSEEQQSGFVKVFMSVAGPQLMAPALSLMQTLQQPEIRATPAAPSHLEQQLTALISALRNLDEKTDRWNDLVKKLGPGAGWSTGQVTVFVNIVKSLHLANKAWEQSIGTDMPEPPTPSFVKTDRSTDDTRVKVEPAPAKPASKPGAPVVVGGKGKK